MNLKPAPHEGDVNFICGTHPEPGVPDYGLKAFYALDSVIKDWDAWKDEGKPSETMRYDGSDWALTLDYQESGLDAWSSPEFQLEKVREFRIYFVDKSSPHYEDGKAADRDKRVKGGTIHVAPRWPDMTSDGEPVSVPDYGHPYVNFNVQASNIQHRKYHDILRRALDAFGVSPRYVEDPHPDSNVQDLAYYVRPERGESGPIYAPDGPIARTHAVIESDREGYRKHVEDHREIPGYYVTASVRDEVADSLIRGHELGKELKHYYPNHPDEYSPDEAPYHPKFEVSYQTSLTEDTLRWSELDDARRELHETILNCLEWSGISPRAESPIWVDFDPYWHVEDTHESRKLVKCPLPAIEDDQEHRVMKLWGDMTEADRDVTELLLTDGGAVSPQEAAERTGNTYRTVREVVDRMEGLIRHTYGELQLESKKVQQELLKRVRAAGERFRQDIGSAAMELADASQERARSAWDRWRREYAVNVEDAEDCRKLFRVGYKPDTRAEAARILREGLTSVSPERKSELEFGTRFEFTLSDGSRVQLDDLHRTDLKLLTRE